MYAQKLYHSTYTMQHPGHPDFGMPMHHPYPSMHGFCHSCCHPMMKCCCGIRECRKEAKELMVSPDSPGTTSPRKATLNTTFHALYTQAAQAAQPVSQETSTSLVSVHDEAFIGGGCCVHLSVEFMPKPIIGTIPGALLVSVVDSEDTILIWMKLVKPGSGYQIKEAIISTNPGAILQLSVFNVIARVRWCECFSC